MEGQQKSVGERLHEPGTISATITAENAGVVAARTRDYLFSRGWCIWRLASLNRERIVIVLDREVAGYPGGLPVYTLDEIGEVAKMPVSTLRLVQIAKRQWPRAEIEVKEAPNGGEVIPWNL